MVYLFSGLIFIKNYVLKIIWGNVNTLNEKMEVIEVLMWFVTKSLYYIYRLEGIFLKY